MNKRNVVVHSQRVEALVCEETIRILRDDVHDPLLQQLQVVRVQRDGGARVTIHYASRLPEEVLREMLRRVEGFIRRQLCHALSMRRCPHVRFERVGALLDGGES